MMELRRRPGLLPIRFDSSETYCPPVHKNNKLRKGLRVHGQDEEEEEWGLRVRQAEWRQRVVDCCSCTVKTAAIYATALLLLLLQSYCLRQAYIKGSFFSTKNRAPMPDALPARTYRQLLAYIETTVRQQRHYLPIKNSNTDYQYPYDLTNCPPTPPPGYPQDFPVMTVLHHWPTDDIQQLPNRSIHQGICVFDFGQIDIQDDPVALEHFMKRIHAYRRAEVPYVIRGDEAVLRTAERWSDYRYMHWLLQDKVFRGEVSATNSIMYWNIGRGTVVPPNFVPPTSLRPFTFDAWYEIANQTAAMVQSNQTHAYLRLDACRDTQPYCDKSNGYWHTGLSGVWFLSHIDHANFLWQELPFFDPAATPASDLYLILPDGQRGINCRFGMPGAVAEMHFDSDRNFIAVLGGERRYILAHPRHCPSMYLYAQHHPMERHSAVDWLAPNLTAFPDFSKVRVNEIVLQAGDVLYLPTQWFHHIVSLTVNYQCNTRSGWTTDYEDLIQQCGFNYG